MRVLTILLLLAFVPGTLWPMYANAAETVEDASAKRRVKRWIRGKLVDVSDLEGYGLRIDGDTLKAGDGRDLVVLVHGLNSTAKRSAGLLASVREAGLPTAAFNYPNDQSITDSAKLLSEDLKQLAGYDARRKVSLVTHSMGGLVARACVEDPALDPGNVRRLIMVAPPNQGSLLARLANGADVWEHTFGSKTGGPLVRLRSSFIDGLAEAADDLQPGSPFLTRLNARPRNPRIRYTIILGTGGAVREWELAAVRKGLQKSGSKIPLLREKVKELDEILADLDEVIRGKGDGVVAVKRGRLEGVEDTVILPFGHVRVAHEGNHKASAEVRAAVLARLKDEPVQAGQK